MVYEYMRVKMPLFGDTQLPQNYHSRFQKTREGYFKDFTLTSKVGFLAFFAPFGEYTAMYTEHVIAIVQRAKVIGVCTAVNMFFELCWYLVGCKFHRTLRCRGGCYGMTQILY